MKLDIPSEKEIVNKTVSGGLAGLAFLAVFFVGMQFVTPQTPSVQLVENKKQETKQVCAEKDMYWTYGYEVNGSSWTKLEKIPEEGVISKDDFRSGNGGVWLTLNVSEAPIEPPQVVRYGYGYDCIDYKQVPVYSKVEVEK